jgi:hypothetical protein
MATFLEEGCLVVILVVIVVVVACLCDEAFVICYERVLVFVFVLV